MGREREESPSDAVVISTELVQNTFVGLFKLFVRVGLYRENESQETRFSEDFKLEEMICLAKEGNNQPCSRAKPRVFVSVRFL